jgi:hypothetical protein
MNHAQWQVHWALVSELHSGMIMIFLLMAILAIGWKKACRVALSLTVGM